ncbi:hypothetical protein HDU97_001761 [Phlyctochytrium planicorne]|nr:hypothetical protein HDU97_001761 [Phlyctochytrium planicorne]
MQEFDDFSSAKTKIEDGVKYIWDESQRAWFPMWDENLISQQQSAYGGNDDPNEQEPKKKPKDKEPPKKKPITSVYVTGLPLDVTIEELKESFEKYGILMEDLATGQPKIKLYKDAEGKFKGDALITYFKEESVDLAINLLDDSPFRFGESVNMRVSKAEFKEKAPLTEEQKRALKVDKKVVQKKIQKLERRLDWFEDEEKAPSKLNKIVVLKNMFTKEEIDADPTLLIDLKEEIRTECENFGEVTNVVLYDHTEDGVVTVKFKDIEAAEACVKRNSGRFFGGQRIVSYLYDGKEKFKKKMTKEEEEVEEEKRLAAYEDWLEKQKH